jgi:hypothetical protein
VGKSYGQIACKQYGADFIFHCDAAPQVAAALCSNEAHLENNYEWLDFALIFTVTNITQQHFSGCVWFGPAITINRGVQ